MAVCAAEHHARKVGLGETGDTDLTVRGIPQGDGNFLQGSGPSDTNVWFGDVSTFGINVYEGRSNTHRVTQTDHGEASAVVSRRDMGYDRGRSIVGGGGNSAGNDLYREKSGNRATVGGVTITILIVCKK